MPQTINTNVSSLNAQRNLNASQNALAVSLQRLSSGLRINSAKDDAAGLAISERFRAQINGLNQAARNANDGISLAQTAEGDLVQVGSNLQRMREIAVQSANATNSATDRAALDLEFQALSTEVDRVAQNSAFNGVKLLDGSFTAQVFQVGANATASDQITIASIASARTSALGQYQGFNAQSLGAITNGAAAAFSVTLTGPGTVYNLGSLATDAKVIAAAINSAGIGGLTATAAVNVATGTTTNGITAAGTDTIVINNTNITVAGTTTASTNVANAVAAINLQSATTGVVASDGGGVVKLTAADGRNIAVSFTAGTSTGGNLASYGLGGLTTQTSVVNASYVASGAVTSVVFTGGGLAASPVTKSVATTGTAVSALDVKTSANSTAALASLDAALAQINTSRADLGAVQNRFSSVVTSLQTTAENLSASRGRILDADFAAETANLTKAQILQQAGTAMLAQANALPQNVLTLLRG